VARILKFLNSSGKELHHINDPEDTLPIPVNGQVVTIGSSKMWVESVTRLRDTGMSLFYLVFVRAIPADDSLANTC